MPTKKSKAPLAGISNEEQIASLGVNYVKCQTDKKQIDSEMKTIRKPLEDYLGAMGKELPNGSFLSVVPFADKEVHLKSTLRTSKSQLPEALDVLKENGLEECIEHVPMIREDIVERMYEEGKISDDILAKIYAPKKSFAFSVDIKPRFDGPED